MRYTPIKMHAHEMHAHEMHAHEMHAHDMHAHEMYESGNFDLPYAGPRRRWPDCQNGPPQAAKTDIHASQGFSISLSFSTQLQHHQTTTNIDAVYIIVYQGHG
jgi:hypothetical protein